MEIDTSKGHPAMDYKEHEQTYKGFLKFATLSTIALIALMAALAIFVV